MDALIFVPMAFRNLQPMLLPTSYFFILPKSYVLSL